MLRPLTPRASGPPPATPADSDPGSADAAYTPLQCLHRLRALQNIITGSGASEADALLCVAGIDGGETRGSSMVIKYLLMGQSGSEMLDSKLDPNYDDVALVITASSVSLYCNHYVLDQVGPLTALWRGLKTHVLTKEEMRDADAAEEFKVSAFVAMVAGSQCFGIVADPPAPGATKPKMQQGAGSVVERWPLVQAYALEQISGGSRGFFTMNHKIADVGTEVRSLLLGLVDPRANVAWLHDHCVPEITRHMEEVLEQLDNVTGGDDRLDMVEADVGEPVTSYYEYALIRERMKDATAPAGRGTRWESRLRVGQRSDTIGEEVHGEEPDDDDGELAMGECGPGLAPSHFVAAVAQPRGPLYAARTYFLQSGCEPEGFNTTGPEATTTEGDDIPGDAAVSDVPLLRRLYVAMVRSMHKALGLIAEEDGARLSAEDIRGAVLASVGAAVAQIGMPADYDISTGLDVEVVAVDALGRVDPEWQAPARPATMRDSPGPTPSVRVVRARLRQIPSLAVPGESAGSLVIADSFIFGGSRNGKVGKGTAVRILTATVPYVCAWLGAGNEEDTAATVLREVADSGEAAVTAVLGKAIWYRPNSAAVGSDRDDSGPIVVDPCSVVLSDASEYMQCLTGTMRIFQRGAVFAHPRFGPFVLAFSRVAKIGIYEAPNVTDPALIVVRLTPAAAQLYGLVSAERLQSSRDSLQIGIVCKGGTKSVLFKEVLPVWKDTWEDCGIEVETLEAPPDSMALAFSKCGSACSCLELGAELRAGAAGSLSADRSVYVHSSSLEEFCAGKETDLELSTSQALEDSSAVPLTIVCGVPGSSHTAVAQSLMAFSKACDWSEVLLAAGEPDFAALISAARAANADAGDDAANRRLLLVTEGYVDVVRLTSAITTHPELSGLCRIASVIAVVKPANFSIRREGHVAKKFGADEEEQFSESTSVLPALLDQCAWGWTNAIVILGSSAAVQNQLQARLSQVNPDATIVRAAYTMQWELAKASDADRSRAAEACLGLLSAEELEAVLSTTAFDSGSMKQVRASVAPQWPQIASLAGDTPVPERVAFEFEPVLDRARLLKSLQQMLTFRPDKSWPEPAPRLLFCQLVARTTDSGEGNYADMTFTAAEADVAIRPTDGKPTSVLMYGENLEHNIEWLKRRLLTCRPSVPSVLKPIENFAQLPTEKLKQIQDLALAENPDRDLPEGTFYDGAMYIDFDGNRSEWHPAMAEWCKAEVDQGNSDVSRQNAEIQILNKRYKEEEVATLAG